jgi:Icc protein
MPRILQLTDVHLHPDEAHIHPRIGMDGYWDITPQEFARRVTVAVDRDGVPLSGQAYPWRTFHAVCAKAHELAAQGGGFDLLVLSGDIVKNRHTPAYRLLRDLLEARMPAGLPIRVIPGNHDTPANMRPVFPESVAAGAPSFSFTEELGGWLVVGLDTWSENESAPGALSAAELAWLREQLEARRGVPTLLFMHHPPLRSVESAALDANLFAAADLAAFEAVLREFAAQVKGICCGHIHQEWAGEACGVPVWVTPSTITQRVQRADEYVLAPLPPGCRVLDLKDTGEIGTAVVWVYEARPEFRPQNLGSTALDPAYAAEYEEKPFAHGDPTFLAAQRAEGKAVAKM